MKIDVIMLEETIEILEKGNDDLYYDQAINVAITILKNLLKAMKENERYACYFPQSNQEMMVWT